MSRDLPPTQERLKEIEAQSAQRGPGGGGHAPAASPPHPPLPPDIYRHQAAYQQHSYMAPGYTHTAQPSPFLQPGMGHMALTMGPQSGMSHTMFGGQPGQFQQWQ